MSQISANPYCKDYHCMAWGGQENQKMKLFYLTGKRRNCNKVQQIVCTDANHLES